MTAVVIFGIGKTADVIATYAERDGAWPIAGFVVDGSHATSERFHDRPVVSWDGLMTRFPPTAFRLFIAVGYQQLNRFRAERMARATAAGYEFASLVSAHAHVAPGVRLGANSAVLDAACVQPGASIGEGTFVWTGAMVGHHSTIGNHAWIVGNASLSGSVRLGDRSFVGAGAVVGHEVTVGADAILGAGSILIRDLPAGGVQVADDTPAHRLSSAQFQRISRMFCP